MPISVRFRLREAKPGQPQSNPCPLQVVVTINRTRKRVGAVWQGEKLVVDPATFHYGKQASTRRGDPVNDQIDQLRVALKAIFTEQQAGKRVATTESVIHEWRTGERPKWDGVTYQVIPAVAEPVSVTPDAPAPATGWDAISEESPLRAVYLTYIIELRLALPPKPKRYEVVRVGRWERGLLLLTRYEEAMQRPAPNMDKVSVNFLNRYHTWLSRQASDGRRPALIGDAMASRYVGQIGQLFAYLAQEGLTEKNPVRARTWPKYADKEIHYLEPRHIAQLMNLNWPRTPGVAVWWFCLMCCTGFDFPDAVDYAQHRARYERTGPAGRKIVGNRNKPPFEAYDVPLLDEVERLFAIYPTGPADIQPQTVNRHTHLIEIELGISWRITAKTARKTFGCMMLAAGFRISRVSRMLGHKRISTTESHYVKVLGNDIDHDRLKIGEFRIQDL